MKVPPRTLVDEETARDLHLEKRLGNSGAVGKLHAKRPEDDGRLDALVADLVDIALNCLETFDWNAEDVVRLVVNTEHENAIVRVGDSRQLVGQLVAPRLGNAIPSKAQGLEL